MAYLTLHSFKVLGRAVGFSALVLSLQGCLLDQTAQQEKEGGEVVKPPSHTTVAKQQHRTTNPVGSALELPDDEVGSRLSRLEQEARERLQQNILAAVPESTDLWVRVRSGMGLPDNDHPEVADEIQWFSEHQRYLDRVGERAALYMRTVLHAIEERGMPTELALLPVIESSYEPLATSPSKAAGLWQFIPSTGRRFGLEQNSWYDGRRDVAESTRAALDYLEYLHNKFDGDWLHAIAAYNWGEGNLERAIERNRAQGKPTDFWSLDMRKETRQYVPRLLALAKVVSDPEHYGLALSPLEDCPLLASVDVGGHISLKTAAQLAGLDEEEIHRFNPGYRRDTTDPSGRHTLLLPSDKVEGFSARLAELPKEQWVHTRYHEVKSGETLAGIATKYWVSAEQLQAANGLADNGELRAGTTLVVPLDAGAVAHSAAANEGGQGGRAGSGGRSSYTVKAGDSLWSIARSHDLSVKELAAWNSLSPKSTIKPGQKLTIASSAGPELQVPARRIGYVIQQGDSLIRIAQRFNISVDDLRRWNKGLDETLYPGNELTVYVGEHKG